MSQKIVVLDDVITKLRKRNDSDGYVTKFYHSPASFNNVKKAGETEAYKRPYEIKLVEQGLSTDNMVSEEVLTYFFQTSEEYKRNDDLKIVLIKVTLLNAFYRTAIHSIDLVAVARYICSLRFDELISVPKNGRPNFDLIMKFAYHQSNYSPEIGDNSFMKYRIKTKNGIKDCANDLYSFATKYCAWHQPDIYPIVDSYTKGVLYRLVNDNEELKAELGLQKVTDSQLNDYKFYYNLYEGFRNYLREERGIDINMKDLDIVLWSYGAENMISR